MNVMSLLLVGMGIAITATFFVISPPPEAASAVKAASAEKAGPDAAGKAGSDAAEKAGPDAAEGGQPEVPAVVGKVEAERNDERAVKRVRVPREPESKMLRVTVPGMSQLRNSEIPYAAGTDEDAFRKYAAVHLRGTGDPWDRVANVYIAGHRLGYPATDSWLAFWDLNRLEKDDKIFVTDAEGRRYVYKVFRSFTVAPDRIEVTRPLKGRNVLTLQTCTLPDYSRRLIVQAEKVAKT